MKWIVLIVVLLVLGGALYLRSVRDQDGRRGPSRPHRLDDSLTPSDDSMSGDDPST